MRYEKPPKRSIYESLPFKVHVALPPIPYWEQKLGTAFNYSYSSLGKLGKNLWIIWLMVFSSQFGILFDKTPFLDLFLSATICCCECNRNLQLFRYFQCSHWSLSSFDSDLGYCSTKCLCVICLMFSV